MSAARKRPAGVVWFPPTLEGEPCLYSTQTRQLWPPLSRTPASMRPTWPRRHFSPDTTDERSMPTATTCGRSSSGPPTRPHRPGSEATPHRPLPHRHGSEGSRPVDHRPPTIDRLRLLPVRPHRRTGHRQPGPVRPAPQGPPLRRATAGSPGARHLSLHRGAMRQSSRRSGRTTRHQRTSSQRGVRNQHRGSRFHPGAPDCPDHGEGEQAGRDSAGSEGRPDY